MLDFDSLLFNIDITSKVAHPGSLLVAEPFLRDNYFSHGVVWLVDYAMGEKAMGIVLNHPTGYTLQQLVPDVTRRDDIPIYCGGPMSCDRLYFVHTLGSIIDGAREVADGLYIGGDFKQMLSYVNSGYPYEGCLRFFLGYSGWDVGQLDNELRNKVWAVADLPDATDALTLDDDAYWHNVVRSMGNGFRGWRYHPKNLRAN